MTDTASQTPSQPEISQWLITRLAALLEIDTGEIDPEESVTVLGVDSMQYLGLIGDLEDWLGCRFADNPFIDYPTINSMSAFVALQLQQGHTTIDPQAP